MQVETEMPSLTLASLFLDLRPPVSFRYHQGMLMLYWFLRYRDIVTHDLSLQSMVY